MSKLSGKKSDSKLWVSELTKSSTQSPAKSTVQSKQLILVLSLLATGSSWENSSVAWWGPGIQNQRSVFLADGANRLEVLPSEQHGKLSPLDNWLNAIAKNLWKADRKNMDFSRDSLLFCVWSTCIILIPAFYIARSALNNLSHHCVKVSCGEFRPGIHSISHHSEDSWSSHTTNKFIFGSSRVVTIITS